MSSSSGRPVVELTASPGALTTYRHAALQRARGGDQVPQQILRLSGIAPDVGHVAEYASVCGDRLSSVLPPLFPHLLGFPLQMTLLTDPACPFPAMGLVHVANSVTIVEQIPISATLDVEVEMAAPQPHRRGRTIDLLARVSVDGEVLWRSSSTYLHREKTSGPSGEKPATEPPALTSEPLAPSNAIWRLPSDLGRQYGSVSGDRNPIHMSALTARLFGFPRAIAHGMWTAARCLGALEGRLPARYTNDVEFKAPISLPGTVEFVEAAAGPGQPKELSYQVRARGKDRVHLLGSVTSL